MSSPATRLAEAIANGGARYAFGVPGGGPNLDVVGALDAAGIDFVLAHTETAACIMASTYGALTGSPTAAVVTRGPGAASAVNGLAQATLDRQPLLLVTDTVPAENRERVPHQRIDQQAMLAPTAKASMVLGAATTVDQLATAVELAAAQPPGGVHIDYDASAQGQAIEPPRPVIRVEVPRAVRDLLNESRHPVVIVGVGAIEAADAIRPVLERVGAPVFTTYQGVGVVDTEGPLNAGLFTNGASEQLLLAQADLVVLVGVDMVEPIPAPWGYDAAVLSIASTATIDPYLPINYEVVGDIGEAVRELLDDDHDWKPGAGAGHREAVRERLAACGPGTFGPVELVAAVADAVPNLGDTLVTVDAGAHFLAVMPFWPTAASRRLLISNGLATMGYAVPAAIGAALATGDPVVAFTGDGGLGMCLAELETIVRLQLPVTVVVFNDAALSLIEIKQRDGHGGPGAVRYQPIDFATVARGMGLEATIVDDAPAVAAAMEGVARPRLIDARIDPSAYRDLIKVTRG